MLPKKISSYSQYTIDKELHIWVANIKTIEVYDQNGKKLMSFSKLNQAKDSIFWQEIEINTVGDIYATSQRNGVGLIHKIGAKYGITMLDWNKKIV